MLDPQCQPLHPTETLLLYCTTWFSEQCQNLTFSLFLTPSPILSHADQCGIDRQLYCIHMLRQIKNLPSHPQLASKGWQKLSGCLGDKRNRQEMSRNKDRAGHHHLESFHENQALNQAVILLANIIYRDFNNWEWYSCVPFENLCQALTTFWVWAKYNFLNTLSLGQMWAEHPQRTKTTCSLKLHDAFFKPNCNVPPRGHKTCSNKQLQFYRRNFFKKLTKVYLKLRLHGGKKNIFL